jgi:uncharacterized cupredoxin-like copper-binding protein
MSIRVWARIGLVAVTLTVAALLTFQPQGVAADPPIQVAVTVKEFTVNSNPSGAATGSVQLNVSNQGALPHELVIMQTDKAPDALLYDDANHRVVESAQGQEDVGEVEAIDPGTSKSGSFDLAPGKYVLICNIADHYKAGMLTAFTVGAVETPTATASATSTASPTPTTAPTPTPSPAITASPTPVITPAAIPHTGGPATSSSGFPWAALIVGIGAAVVLAGLASVTMIQRQRWR